MSRKKTTASLLLPAILGTASAQTVLIDYDDGIPGNGVHDASIRNGGFEDTAEADGRTIADLPTWDCWFADSTTSNGTSEEGPWLWNTSGNSEPHRTSISGWENTTAGHPRRQLAHVIPSSDWTLSEGDTFHLELSLKEGSGMNNEDFLQIKAYAYDGTTPGLPTSRSGFTEIAELQAEAPDDGSWGKANLTFSVKSSAYNGQQLALRFLLSSRGGDATRNEFCIIDDIALTTVPVPVSKPNIVFFLADDLGWTDISTPNTTMGHGSDFHQTPNIDSLATQGVSFNSFYVNPNCAPTRAAFLSGRFSAGAQNGVYNVDGLNRGNGTPSLRGPDQNEDVPASATTLAEMLKRAGYMTAHVGKYHAGGHEGGDGTLPLNQGYDWNYGGTNKGNPGNYIANTSNQFGSTNVGPELDAFAQPYTQQYVDDNLKPYANGNNPDTIVGDRKHLTDAEADACIEFLSNHVNSSAGRSGRPFYLQWHSYSVHDPVTGRGDLVSKYQGLPDGTYHSRNGYAALVEGQDQAIARILAFLDDPNGDGDDSDSIADNTLVIYCSDNGGHVGETFNDPLRVWKGSVYDGGIRVPFIARMPGTIPANAITNALGQHVDLYPTLMEIAGGSTETTLDGVSLWSHLLDPATAPPRSAAYVHFPGYLDKRARPCSVIIKDVDGKRYKSIYNYDFTYDPDTGDNRIKVLSQPWELYNLTDDISESTNLIDDSYTGWLIDGAAADELASDLLAWLDQPGDPTWNASQPTVRSSGAEVPYPPGDVPDVAPGPWAVFETTSHAFTPSTGSTSLTFNSETGFLYDIWGSNNLVDWDLLREGVSPTGSSTTETFTDPGAPASSRFYKVDARRP